jgi:hypothetical protein
MDDTEFEDETDEDEDEEFMYGDEPSWRAACRADSGVRWGS